MTTKSYTQQKLEDADKQLRYFAEYVNIPSGYKMNKIDIVTANGISAILFRYTKEVNNKLNEEHFSFIVTEKEPYRILGFTNMDSRYADKKQLSKKETENIARKFLEDIDPELSSSLSNLWVEPHDEEIVLNDNKIIIRGMKYKCYNKSVDNYAWVIVGFDGSIITFERDIVWSNGMQQRVTEKWLHDSWVMENR